MRATHHGPKQGEQPRRTGLFPLQLKPASNAAAAAPAATSSQQAATTSGTFYQHTLFEGADDIAQGPTPPDTAVAAGTNDVVEMVNSRLIITDKTGTVLKTSDLSSFFQAGPTTLSNGSTANLSSVSDPKVVYNRFSGHFYATELIYDSANDSAVKLAVSQTSDPTGAWLIYTVHPTAGTLLDQPKLGVSLDKIVLTWNKYTGSGSSQSYTGTETYVADQAEAENYGNSIPLDYALFDDGQNMVFPAVNVDTDPNSPSDAYEAYFHKDFFGFSYITVNTITGVPGSLPGVSRSSSNDVGIATTSSPPPASQPNTSLTLDTGDDRIESASFRGGALWVAANDSCQPSGQPTMSCVRTVLLTNAASSSPTKAFDGDFYSGNAAMFYPAITMDDSNDVFLAASASGPSLYPSLGVFAAQAGGTSISGSLVRTGRGPLSCDVCGSANPIRFGDYSGISLDGSNANMVWIGGEYGNASSTTLSPTWGTAIGEYSYF
ncbi:hypothetical protein [Streptomyces roseochromogenus]|uniref:hypothetical protein n=1 Tax=Streptomyces roseochromogenus TaxID=285450 RepID=UPI00131A1425|nr:hypothetical protein [Streptomyces roseochromogenus]